MHDPALRGNAVEVYLVAADVLSVVEFTPVKVAWLAHELRLSESAIARALHVLESAGYLDREPNTAHPAAFRLFYSKHEHFVIPDYRR